MILIHHSTSEILGLIEALNRLECSFVQILFIKYKGIVPDSHEDRSRPSLLQ